MRLNPTDVATTLAVAFLLSAGCASPPSLINENDVAVVEQIRASGSNPENVHLFNFFLRFPTQETADGAARVLRSDNYRTAIREAADSESWLCVAKLRFVPTLSNVAETRTTLEDVARRHGGQYEEYDFVVNR